MAKGNRIFQPNLIYVFSFKKYKQESRKLKLKMFGWEKEFNGQLVVPTPRSNKAGNVLGTSYLMSIKWCKCIGKKVQ